MRFSTVFVAVAALAAASFTTAAPAAPKPGSNAKALTVLNYALTLEHLEAEFYKQGLAKFNDTNFTDAGFDAKVRDRFVHIGEHESEHVATLTSVIESMKGKPVPICNYTFPMDNLTQFLAVAQALENTGVSAYLGAASGLSGDLLTAAASITTVEARHAAYLNELWGQSGFPYAFDTALGPREIVTIAMNFITSCPYKLGVNPFTQLTASLPAAGSNSTMVKTSFEGMGSNMTDSTYCQFLFGNNVTVSPRSECALPQNASGYIYVLVTKDKTPISLTQDSNVLAGPALLFNGTHSA
ncbi:MAG: ferritin-like domain-containing protein [Linnemannia gamsii]|nr:MAG: ferritin-like domain-containing protein [Linnemannia gamsii]